MRVISSTSAAVTELIPATINSKTRNGISTDRSKHQLDDGVDGNDAHICQVGTVFVFDERPMTIKHSCPSQFTPRENYCLLPRNPSLSLDTLGNVAVRDSRTRDGGDNTGVHQPV